MISGLGAHSPQRPTYAGRPLPGIQPVLLDGDANEITGDGVEGYLCVKHPWPSMLPTVSKMYSNTNAAMCTGVQPMWVGLLATATSSTDRY